MKARHKMIVLEKTFQKELEKHPFLTKKEKRKDFIRQTDSIFFTFKKGDWIGHLIFKELNNNFLLSNVGWSNGSESNRKFNQSNETPYWFRDILYQSRLNLFKDYRLKIIFEPKMFRYYICHSVFDYFGLDNYFNEYDESILLSNKNEALLNEIKRVCDSFKLPIEIKEGEETTIRLND